MNPNYDFCQTLYKFEYRHPYSKVIGKGGFGTVYSCIIHSKPTAVKAIQQPDQLKMPTHIRPHISNLGKKFTPIF